MSRHKELEQQVEVLGGQMVGVQAAFDALLGATIQTGAAKPNTLKIAVKSAIEVFPMNPNMRKNEVAGATAFLSSVLETIDRLESGYDKGAE